MTLRRSGLRRIASALAAALLVGMAGCGPDDRADEVAKEIWYLGSTEVGSRSRAAEALGSSGDARSVKPLIGALDDATWAVRKRAAEALGKLGDARAVAPLICCVKDGNADLRSIALESLVKLGRPSAEPLIACLKDGDPFVRERAAQTLGKLGDVRAIPPLAECLKDPDADVCAAATAALDALRKQSSKP